MSTNSYYEKEQDLALHNLINDQGPTKYPSHFHKKLEITYMVAGSCISQINNHNYFAEENDILYVSSYIPHSYDTSNDAQRILLCPLESLLVDFNTLTENKIFPCLLTNKEFNKKQIYPVLTDLLSIHKNKFISSSSKFLISKGLTNVFYGKLLDGYGDLLQNQSKSNENICKMLDYIDQNSSKNIKIKDVANYLGYSVFYLSRIFNNTIGQNFNSYLNSVRIKKFIKIFNQQPNLKITNLAFELGFESTTSFYRAFYSTFSCTPSEYIKKKI